MIFAFYGDGAQPQTRPAPRTFFRAIIVAILSGATQIVTQLQHHRPD